MATENINGVPNQAETELSLNDLSLVKPYRIWQKDPNPRHTPPHRPVKEGPLHKAARNGDLAQCQRLIEAGMNVDARDESGMTPLMWGILHNSDLAKIFIGAGANVNARMHNGQTPLNSSAFFGLPTEISLLLIVAGADVNARDENGETALMVARNHKVAEILINAGADVHAISDCGLTAIDYAEQNNRPDVVSVIVAAQITDKMKVPSNRAARETL